MKWKTRFIICNLLAGLITLTYSGCRDAPAVQLLSSQTLDFPSASGIEFYEGKLVLFGDNAPYLLVLSPSYQVLQKITYWRDTAGMISKEEKPDIESALLTEKNGKTVVMGIGSQSGANRWPVYAWTVGEDSVQKSKFFPDRLRFPGIQEINLEGSTRVNNQFVFCNRANLTTKINHLIFWTEPGRFAVKEIRLPRADSAAGLSGLYYIKEKDLLLFTATEEATYSATEDGAIGESRIGWIRDFTKNSNQPFLQASGVLKLSVFAKEFSGQKIEGICAETVKGDTYRLHLVADNDNGKSGLFTVDLTL